MTHEPNNRTSAQDSPASTSGPSLFIRESGHGFELLDNNGNVIAWTFDKLWALRILLGLGMLDAESDQQR